MKLKGISIKNYRSFGHEVVLNDLGKINILIGPNNTGKSNILRFLSLLGKNGQFHLGNLAVGLEEEDYFNLELANQVEFRIDFELPDGFGGTALTPFQFKEFYVRYRIGGTKQGTSIEMISSPVHDANEEDIRVYVRNHLGISGGSFEDRKIQALRSIRPEAIFTFPEVIYLDEFRKLANNKELVKELHSIIHADYRHQINKQKKQKLDKFISEVFGKSVEINIPDTENDIELIIDSKHLPLTSFGTGLQEIIVLGYYFISHENSIVCIDEPELHLHPAVQRAFLKFISENTTNQYFISTHSNSFLDYEVEKNIFNVKTLDSSTNVVCCSTTDEISEILSELGIRASEIIQTNGIIWVEGPSDRIYIKKWLEFYDNVFKEGFHYSFQYYGGRVLSHYSLSDIEFKEFLNMLFINRNGFIVMDSDMSKSYQTSDLRQTKQRIIEEAEKTKVGYWITAGREIENYLSNSVLGKFAGNNITRNRYNKIDSYCDKYKDKITDSRKITELMDKQELESNYDLSDKIKELAEIIRKWNGLN